MLAMRNIKEARFSKPVRSDPNLKDPKLWYEYRRTNGHQTWECRHLREEVATLLKNGHLRELLSDWLKKTAAAIVITWNLRKHEKINMIFGGNEINGMTFSVAKKMKVSITHKKKLREFA